MRFGTRYSTDYGMIELTKEEIEAYLMCSQEDWTGRSLPDHKRFGEPLDMLHKRFTARAKRAYRCSQNVVID